MNPKLRIHTDQRGSLAVIDFSEIPFEPVRFFWLFDTKEDSKRAGHAHKSCSQFLICQFGIVQISVADSLGNFQNYILSVGDTFLLPPLNWLEIDNISKSGVLGVWASQSYDPKEYINSFEEFMKFN
jgi:hypothetical protein